MLTMACRPTCYTEHTYIASEPANGTTQAGSGQAGTMVRVGVGGDLSEHSLSEHTPEGPRGGGVDLEVGGRHVAQLLHRRDEDLSHVAAAEDWVVASGCAVEYVGVRGIETETAHATHTRSQ